MVISLRDLEKCFQLLIIHAQDRGVIELGSGANDYYWNVPSDEWLKFQKEPIVDVGSLEDDIKEIRKVIAEPSRISVVDFERLASLLKLLSAELDLLSSNQAKT